MSIWERVSHRYFVEGPAGEFEGIRYTLPKDLGKAAVMSGVVYGVTELFTRAEGMADVAGSTTLGLGACSLLVAGVAYLKNNYGLEIGIGDANEQ